MTRQNDASEGVKSTEILLTNQTLSLTEDYRHGAEIHVSNKVLLQKRVEANLHSCRVAKNTWLLCSHKDSYVFLLFP